jgi:hypothetical protein
MPLDKLKADKLQRNRSRQRREGKQRDQVEMLCHLRDTNSLLLSCHLEIGPKPVDDTFTLNFLSGCEKSLTMLETSGITSKTMNYTPRLECFPFTGQYYLLIKTKISHGS